MEIRENRAFAYEIKYLIPAERASDLRVWARGHLEADPHAEGGGADGYRTTSLYYDTYGFDVFHRRGSYARAKYRIRRYGHAGMAFLERKLRSQSVVTKRRTRVDLAEIERLGNEPDPAWEGYWFHRRVQARAMSPACQISYSRTALVGLSRAGLIRLTLDEDLRGRRVAGPEFQAHGSGTPLLPAQAILELKFRLAMPARFKELVEEFRLQAQPVSKYRLAAIALGCAPVNPEATWAEAAHA